MVFKKHRTLQDVTKEGSKMINIIINVAIIVGIIGILIEIAGMIMLYVIHKEQ